MGQALLEIWETYKGEITPALITIILGLLGYLANTLRVNIKLGVKKDTALISGITAISNREDLKPEIKTLTEDVVDTKKEIFNLREGVTELADLLEYVFSNTDLKPSVKENISVKVSKMKNQTADKLLTELIEERDVLKEQVKVFQKSIEEESKVIVEDTVKKTKERIRR